MFKMNATRKKRGVTLTELLVTMAALGLLAGIGISAVKGVMASFESPDRISNVIGAALASARATAIRQQKYAGLRFQRDKNGDQHMIFIVHDQAVTDLAHGFRAVQGRNPVRLPRGGGVMDLRLRTDLSDATNPADTPITTDAQLDSVEELRDTMAFSVIFTPAGKLVTFEVRVRGANGGIFGDETEVDAGDAMFYQDDYPEIGLGQEPSRNRFVIFNKSQFVQQAVDERWTGYLQSLEPVFVNPYSGRLVGQ